MSLKLQSGVASESQTFMKLIVIQHHMLEAKTFGEYSWIAGEVEAGAGAAVNYSDDDDEAKVAHAVRVRLVGNLFIVRCNAFDR